MDNGKCFWCGHQFEDCDLPHDNGRDFYGRRKIEYEGRKKEVFYGGKWHTETDNSHDRLSADFLPGLHICRDCLAQARAAQNKCGKFDHRSDGIKRMDAEHAKRVREMSESAGGFYNPRTWHHPALTKWDAAVRSGKIKLGISASYRLVPSFPKGTLKKAKGATVQIMTDEEAAEFAAECKTRKERIAAQERAAIEAARESQRVAMASCRTIGQPAAAMQAA